MALKMSSEIFDLIYPIGSIYLCVNNANPGDLFGGTWTKMSGGYLYGCASSIDNSSYTGIGTQSHILTPEETASKNIWVGYGYHAAGSGDIITCSSGTISKRRNAQNEDGVQVSYKANASQGHSHNVAYIGVWVWKRTG